MTVISDIDEFGINTNLKVRYKKDHIYVSMHTLYSVVAGLQDCMLGLMQRLATAENAYTHAIVPRWASLNTLVILLSLKPSPADLLWYYSRGSQSLPSAKHLRNGKFSTKQ